MRKLPVLLASILTALIVVIAAAGSGSNLPSKQHFMNFGPFCISKSTGVMRAVATGQQCRIGEKRIAHKRIPLTDNDPVGAGSPGPKGAKGATGKTGAKGAQGIQGIAGPAGPKGDNGSAGAQGAAGPAGLKGDTGAVGPAGPAGENGAQGEQGPQGVPGLPGAPGAKGDTGATGPQGPKGDAGATGATGPQGPAGPAGKDGLGNATATLCVSNGGTVQVNVNGQPCGDNNGHTTQLDVVIVSSTQK